MKIKTHKVIYVAFNSEVVVDHPDDWICLCGNRPMQDGFYPCNAKGEMVEPTVETWTTNWYVCARCGRIIDQNTLEVVDVRGVKAR